MKIEVLEGSVECKIVIGMIVDSVFLGRICEHWSGSLFSSRWANLVGEWCVDYFQRYKTAPKNSIEGIFTVWAEEGKDDSLVRIIEKFLSTLADAYEQRQEEINTDHLTDVASEHFNKTQVKKLQQQLEGHVDTGQVDEAIKKIHNFGKIEISPDAGVDVVNNDRALAELFGEEDEDLILYPGSLGKFFSGQLQRECFVSFLAPEKRGKTFWLIDMAWRAMLQRRKVAFFATGDMSQKQMLRRFIARAAKRPFRKGRVDIPVKMKVKPGRIPKIEHRVEEYSRNMSRQEADMGMRQIRKMIRSENTYLRMSCHPNSSINVRGIESVLQTWERDDWVPDVVVIDYADILAPPDGVQDTRDQINTTWKHLRGLSQSLRCLLVTATQANAASYKAERLTMRNFSEDKRKMAHVTAMIGLNRSEKEKERGIMRLNPIVMREGNYSENRCVFAATCLDIANPAMISCFPQKR